MEKNNRNKNKEGKERGIKMDTQQMFQELDSPLCARENWTKRKRKMMGWMKEGLDSGNKSLCLMMCNEMEGLYRNTGRVAQAVDMADMALTLIAGGTVVRSTRNDTFKCGNRAPDGRRCGESAFPVPGGGSDF